MDFRRKNSLEMTKFTPMRDTIIQYTLARKNERMSKWNEQREKKEHTTRHTPERKMENRKLYLVSSQNHTLTILFWNLFEIQIFILSHFTSILSTFCSFSRLKFEVKKRQIFRQTEKMRLRITAEREKKTYEIFIGPWSHSIPFSAPKDRSFFPFATKILKLFDRLTMDSLQFSK